MRLVSKLVIVFVVVLVALASVTVLGFRVIGELGAIANAQMSLAQLTQETWRLRSLTYEIRVTTDYENVLGRWRQSASDLLAYGGSLATDRELLRQAARNDALAQNVEGMTRLLELFAAEIEHLENALADFTNDFSEFPSDSISDIVADGNVNVAFMVVRPAQDVSRYLDSTLQGVVQSATAELETETDATVNRLMLVFIGVAAAASVAVAIIILALRRSLRVQFADIGQNLQLLSDGDLTARVGQSGRDEVSGLSRAVQHSVDDLSDVVRAVQQISEVSNGIRSELVASSERSAASATQIGGNVSSIASTIAGLDQTVESTSTRIDQIAAGIRDLERAIEQHARSVEESSSAVEQMTASLTNIAKVTQDRRDAADRMNEVTRQGHEQVQTTNERVAEIAESMESMLEIVGVINGIASQTSMLSMNAAIESAHAGDYGRGFSVVAEEIRRLSDSTNENAKSIMDQLRRVVDLARETQTTSETTQKSFGVVEREVASTDQALNEIASTIDEIARGAGDLLSGTAELREITAAIRTDANAVSAGSQEIATEMRRVTEISASVSGGIKEIEVGTGEIQEMVSTVLSSSRDMTEQVALLADSVNRYRTEDPSGSSMAAD